MAGGGYPTEGKPGEKGTEMHPEIWKRYIAFAAIVVIVAAVAYFAGQAPVQTSTDTGGGSQGGNGNPAGIVTGTATPTATASETVEIPADALKWQEGAGIFLINEAPKSIFVKKYNTLITNLEISDTKISGYWINTVPNPRSPSVGGNLGIAFLDNEGSQISGLNWRVSKSGNKVFATIDRPAETLQAVKVRFEMN